VDIPMPAGIDLLVPAEPRPATDEGLVAWIGSMVSNRDPQTSSR